MIEVACWLAIAAVALYAARLGGHAVATLERADREQLRSDVDGWEDRA